LRAHSRRRSLAVAFVVAALGLVFAGSAQAGDPLGSLTTASSNDTVEKAAAPVTKTVEKANTPATRTVEKTGASARETVDRTAAPAKRTVEKTAAPATRTVEKTAAPVTRTVERTVTRTKETVEKTTGPVTRTVDRTVTRTKETVDRTAAPIVKTVERVAAPATETVEKTFAPVAKTLDDTTTSVAKTLEDKAAPIAQVVDKTLAPLVETVEGTAAPIGGEAAPTRTAATRVAPSSDRPADPSAGTYVAARPAPPEGAGFAPHETTQPSAVSPPHIPATALVPFAAPGSDVAGDQSGAARARTLQPGSAPSVPAGGAGSSGGISPLTFFFGIFAALIAALSVAAQRLSRWIRLTPDLRRPPSFISLLERPG
jgi:hypothetical protein